MILGWFQLRNWPGSSEMCKFTGARYKTEVALGVAGEAAGSPLCICSQEAKVRLWLTPGGQAIFSYSHH